MLLVIAHVSSDEIMEQTQLWLADGIVIPGIGCTQSDSISVRVAIA